MSDRERDIRTAIAGALTATGAFDAASLTGLPEDYGQGASRLALAVIAPGSTRRLTGWDGEPLGQVAYDCTIRLTILARDEDPQLRDELAEQLLNTAIDAIDGQVLVAGLTVPQLTAVTAWTWQPESPPERRIQATLSTRYLVAWGAFGTAP